MLRCVFKAGRRPRMAWLALVGLLAFPQASHAITLRQCAEPWRDYLDALEVQYGENVPDDEVTELINSGAINMEFINSIDDPENLSDGAREWSRLAGEPVSGEAEYQQLVHARRQMIVCMYEQRLAEVTGKPLDDEDIPASKVKEEPPEEDLSGPPTPVEASLPWFSGEDFPASALDAGRQGLVRYVVTVNAAGKAVGCQADGPEGGSDLELATCNALMARAQFHPATDHDGAPVAGEVEGTIRWTLPE